MTNQCTYSVTLMLWNKINVKHYDRVSVFLLYLSGMQSARAVLYCHLWPIWLLPYFSTVSYKWHDFRKTSYWTKILSFYFSTNFSKIFLLPRKILKIFSYHKRVWFFLQSARCSCQVLIRLEILVRFSKNTCVLNFKKIHSVRYELLHPDREIKRR